jgi:uncharacterized protein (TIGR03066 family)
MRTTIVCLSVLCASLIVVAAPVPKERAEAEKVVGTWKLVKSSHAVPKGETIDLEMELTHGGKIVLRQSNNGDSPFVAEGEYKVMKNEFPYSIKLPGGVMKMETLTIKKLTETELVLVDPDGVQEDFVRVKSKKEEPKSEEKKP